MVSDFHRLIEKAVSVDAAFLLMADGFFDAGSGGAPVWAQHFWWFIGHPEIFLPLLTLVGLAIYLTIRKFRSK